MTTKTDRLYKVKSREEGSGWASTEYYAAPDFATLSKELANLNVVNVELVSDSCGVVRSDYLEV